MAGKVSKTGSDEGEKEKAEPKTAEEKKEAMDGAEMATVLSEDAINALAEAKAAKEAAAKQREIGGPKGPEPTRFGDWENKGRCIDF